MTKLQRLYKAHLISLSVNPIPNFSDLSKQSIDRLINLTKLDKNTLKEVINEFECYNTNRIKSEVRKTIDTL